MQSPSSLIFLVLLGVWAAYFVQYWVRRRDHVATARSVEQFSTAMRVLERRDALPRTDLSEPAPRSYAVHPSRAARPQVMVKRAVAAEQPAPGTVTERIERAPRPAPVEVDRPARVAPAAARPAPSRVARPQVRPSRRVRGLLFLVAVAELVAIVPLVATSLLAPWALAPAFVALVAALAFVRSGVRTEAALARAHRRRLADLERLRTTAPVVARPTAARPVAHREATAPSAARRPSSAAHDEAFDDVPADAPRAETAPDVVAGSVVELTPEPEVASAPPIAPAARTPAPLLDPVLEVSAPAAPAVAATTPAAEVMVPIEVDDDIPLTWDPVPVPRPTYTMKARAQRHEVPPAAVTPDPASVARDTDDDSAYPARRVAGA